MKPFKTYRQQIKILRSRGLVIPNGSKAMRILEKENYYRVINGYKDLFLEVDATGKYIIPEKYKPGSTFDEIHKLFCFDRELRNILLEVLLKFESSLKTKTAYRFSERYKESNAYLKLTNYSRDPKKLKDILRLIAMMSTVISNHSDREGSPIKHYLDNHDGVPLWVLVNFLTIGNMQYLYFCLNDSLQNVIAKDFGDVYNRQYKTRIHFTADELQSIIKTANYFRNVCAHEERLYNYKIHKPARSSNLSSILHIPIQYLDKGNVFSMIAFLKIVIDKRDYQLLTSKLKKLIDAYSTSFHSVSIDDVLEKMGFPNDWKSYLHV